MHTACVRCGLLHPPTIACRAFTLPVAATSEAGTLLAGTLLAGRYRIARALHRGGMSVVYLAEDTRQGRQVALKELRLPDGASPEEAHEAEVWFARESYLLSTLRHPLIPHFYSVFREDGRSYIAQEYVEGEDLDRLVAGEGPREERQVIAWGQSLCALLTYLHGLPEPVVFRDLKPANVLLRRADGQLAVVDFGIARTCPPGQVATVVGTPGYAPPEQYQGLPTAQSDLYALGATLHRLLTGYDPEQGTPFAFPAPRTLNPQISPQLEAVLLRALRLAPSERFASAADFGAALRAVRTPRPRPARNAQPGGTALQHLGLVIGLALLLPLCAIWIHRTPYAAPRVEFGAAAPQVLPLPSLPAPRQIRYAPSCRPRPEPHLGPTSLVVRGPGRTLWFVKADADGIGAIGMDGQIRACALSDDGASPTSMAWGPGGTLWIVQSDSGTILRMSPGGALRPFHLGGFGELGAISPGADGNMWCTLGITRAIGRITPAGVVTRFQLPGANTVPDGLAPGPDGALWFPEYQSNRIGRITVRGAVSELSTVDAIGAGAGGITGGPDRSFWFTSGNTIYRLDKRGKLAQFATPNDREQLVDITAGPDGNLWFVDDALGFVGRITPQGRIAQFALPDPEVGPGSIVAGPDGNLWFSEEGGQAIGRITPSGRIIEFGGGY